MICAASVAWEADAETSLILRELYFPEIEGPAAACTATAPDAAGVRAAAVAGVAGVAAATAHSRDRSHPADSLT